MALSKGNPSKPFTFSLSPDARNVLEQMRVKTGAPMRVSIERAILAYGRENGVVVSKSSS